VLGGIPVVALFPVSWTASSKKYPSAVGTGDDVLWMTIAESPLSLSAEPLAFSDVALQMVPFSLE